MLLTVTLNPSVDISYKIDSFLLDDVNRVENVSKTAGGKGLNVTRVAHLLGVDTLATGMIGGTIGMYITEELNKQGINHEFFQINQESRNCIAILHDGKQTEILESGPHLTTNEGERFLEHLTNILKKQPISVLSISGSLPKGLTADVYEKIIALANKEEIPVILDTSGSALKDILDNPSLKLAAIKPNRDELSALEGKELSDNPEEWQQVLQSSRYKNCEWVVVSMGAKGAFAKHNQDFYSVAIPKINVVNPVGSGDATVAGIAKALEEKQLPEALLQSAMTAGMLNTMEDSTGHVDPNLFTVYFDKVQVRKFN